MLDVLCFISESVYLQKCPSLTVELTVLHLFNKLQEKNSRLFLLCLCAVCFLYL